MLNKGEMTVEKAIDVMSDTGFFSPASCYSEEEQLAALYLAIRILEEKAEEEAKMQEEQAKASGRREEMNEDLKAKIMRLQTYKMYEGERTVYVERNDVLKAITETENKDRGQRPATETTGKWAYYFCPVCHQEVAHKQKYCSNCGMSIIWPISERKRGQK